MNPSGGSIVGGGGHSGPSPQSSQCETATNTPTAAPMTIDAVPARTMSQGGGSDRRITSASPPPASR